MFFGCTNADERVCCLNFAIEPDQHIHVMYTFTDSQNFEEEHAR